MEQRTSQLSSTLDDGEDRRKRTRMVPNEDLEADASKPYECRFCPMKFSKSQALGGHMNRHRQGKNSYSPSMGELNTCSNPTMARNQHFPQQQRSNSDRLFNYSCGTPAPILEASAYTDHQATPYNRSSALPSNAGWINNSNLMQSYMVQPSVRNRIIGSSSSGQQGLGMSYERNVVAHHGNFPLDSNSGLINISSHGGAVMQQRANPGYQRQTLNTVLQASRSSNSTGVAERQLVNYPPTSIDHHGPQFDLLGCDVSALKYSASTDTGRYSDQGSNEFNLPSMGDLPMDPSASSSFPRGVTNMPTADSHMEGLPWMYGGQKPPSPIVSMTGEDFGLALANDTEANEANPRTQI
eukprot:Gb_04808 [translate_table: standard]